MKFSFATLLLLLTFSALSSELSISFRLEGLKESDSSLEITLESTNPLCAKVHVGIGGIAIAPSSQYLEGELISEGDRLVARAVYHEGGFCQYKLATIDLKFHHEKNLYFWTRLSILSKETWGGGYLDYTELSTNQNGSLVTTCEGQRTNSMPTCKTYNNGIPYGTSNLGKLYLWQEHLREIDAYNGGRLVFKETK